MGLTTHGEFNSSRHPYTGHNYNNNGNINTSLKGEFCFPLVLFCIVISAYIIKSFKYNALISQKENEGCMLDQLTNLRLINPKKVTFDHLNINSIPNKFDGIMDFVSTNLDVFLISETKIDSSFPEAQFVHNGYAKPYRKDRSLGGGGGGGGLLMYVNENIASCMMKQHTLPDDLEIMCVEINLKKQKWIIIAIYRPPHLS